MESSKHQHNAKQSFRINREIPYKQFYQTQSLQLTVQKRKLKQGSNLCQLRLLKELTSMKNRQFVDSDCSNSKTKVKNGHLISMTK